MVLSWVCVFCSSWCIISDVFSFCIRFSYCVVKVLLKVIVCVWFVVVCEVSSVCFQMIVLNCGNVLYCICIIGCISIVLMICCMFLVFISVIVCCRFFMGCLCILQVGLLVMCSRLLVSIGFWLMIVVIMCVEVVLLLMVWISCGSSCGWCGNCWVVQLWFCSVCVIVLFSFVVCIGVDLLVRCGYRVSVCRLCCRCVVILVGGSVLFCRFVVVVVIVWWDVVISCDGVVLVECVSQLCSDCYQVVVIVVCFVVVVFLLLLIVCFFM